MYYASWLKKSNDEVIIPYSESEYKLYERISFENSRGDKIQRHHYMDEGCSCIMCESKRVDVRRLLENNKKVTKKIVHDNAIERCRLNVNKVMNLMSNVVRPTSVTRNTVSKQMPSMFNVQ